jgi:hypothetical protein
VIQKLMVIVALVFHRKKKILPVVKISHQKRQKRRSRPEERSDEGSQTNPLVDA